MSVLLELDPKQADQIEIKEEHRFSLTFGEFTVEYTPRLDFALQLTVSIWVNGRSIESTKNLDAWRGLYLESIKLWIDQEMSKTDREYKSIAEWVKSVDKQLKESK